MNIAALSRRTGVAPDTLRKWEQRYGILRPRRTTGGQRRYDDSDVARVEWLRARLGEGYRIGEAATLLGGAELEVASTPEELQAAIVDAVARADESAITRLLDQAFQTAPLEAVFTEVVEPVLRRVGEGWEAGELSVAQEHLVSGAVRARLDLLLADVAGSRPRSRRARLRAGRAARPRAADARDPAPRGRLAGGVPRRGHAGRATRSASRSRSPPGSSRQLRAAGAGRRAPRRARRSPALGGNDARRRRRGGDVAGRPRAGRPLRERRLGNAVSTLRS